MKIGDYVRTNFEITKIVALYYEAIFDGEKRIEEKDIVKSSPNIIDLIEVGDYVNGDKVDFININNKLSYEDKCIGFYGADGDIFFFEKDIKSIVTKEQFEAMQYNLESEVN